MEGRQNNDFVLNRQHTIVDKILHRIPKIEQHEPNENRWSIMHDARTWWWLQQTEHIREQLWHVHSGKSSHCVIFEMIIRDPRHRSLIDHDKNHILWQYRWQRLSCFAIIESILYLGCERLQYIVLTEII